MLGWCAQAPAVARCLLRILACNTELLDAMPLAKAQRPRRRKVLVAKHGGGCSLAHSRRRIAGGGRRDEKVQHAGLHRSSYY